MLTDLIRKNRSYRRFEESHAIDTETLRGLVDLARLSASGANMQPLKYLLTNTPEQNAKVFPHLGWAGYLAYWHGPEEGERPSAYIIILGDTEIKEAQHMGIDPGIAAQSIMLGAAEKGLGGCMLGSIQKDALRQDLNIPAHYEILLVLALGKPAESVLLEDLPEDGSIKYYRDEADVHHVPKRALDEIIVEL
ncbi:MAG: nitroreductase family protein [Anaerolineales bacterium]|nr:nitroreductase family protein [Anaerolineales bacterium]